MRLRLAAALALAFCAAPAAADERVTLQSRPNVTEDVLYFASPAPKASAVMMIGAQGVNAFSPRNTNFLLRIRGDMAARGISVALPDAPSDHQSGLDPSFRASAEHAQDIAAVVAFLKGKFAGPVWLVGTSNGSISAANGAARLGPKVVAGIVLTSSVWSGGMSYVPLAQIAVPVLIVHNRNDRCPSARPAGAEQAMAQLTSAPAKEFMPFESTASDSAPCEPLAPHGYYGIEAQVTAAIATWMLAH